MAAPASQPTGSYRFGPFELDPVSGDLRKSGLRVALQDQPLAILLALLASPGRLVTRDELRHRLWREDTFVDFEHGLNAAIKRLRDTLGDSADSPHLIETVPRRGYRFIGALQGFPVGVVAVAPQTPGSGAPAETGGGDAVAVPPGARDRSTNREASSVGTLLAASARASGSHRMRIAAGSLLLVAALAVLAFLVRPSPPPPGIIATTQIALRPGRFVGRLATDGSRLYFTERGPQGDFVVMQVAVAGGEPVPLPLPGIGNPIVTDLSPDGSELLVRAFISGESSFDGDPLWVVDLPEASARRLAGLRGRDATFSPDGQRLVFATRTELHTANRDGTAARKVLTTSEWPCSIRWSPDGERLRFLLPEGGQFELRWWETATDGTGLRRVLSERPVRPSAWGGPYLGSPGGWTRDGRYFVFVSYTGDAGPASVWAHPERSGGRRASGPVPLTTGPLDYTAVEPAADGRRLYAAGQQLRGELVRLDTPSGVWQPFLSGISAEMVGFSADGEWVAYVTFPEGTLWRSRVNGEDRRQLTHPPLQAVTPRWSPDGRRIAFGGAKISDPFRVFVVPSDGGALEGPLPADTDGRVDAIGGDPTWSPDGRALAYYHYGGKDTSILVLDVTTRAVQTLPGSEGLFSARWSPAGRNIAALSRREVDSGLLLYDLDARVWTRLYGEGTADWPSWSHDGEWIYFHATPRTGASGIYRVRVSDRRLELVADPQGFVGEGIFGLPWWGLTPDGALLTLRSTSTWGLFAFDWEAP